MIGQHKIKLRFLDFDEGDGKPFDETEVQPGEEPQRWDRIKVGQRGPYNVSGVVKRYGKSGLLGLDVTVTRKTYAQFQKSRLGTAAERVNRG